MNETTEDKGIRLFRYSDMGARVATDPAAAAKELRDRIERGQTGGAIAKAYSVDATTLRRWIRTLREGGQEIPQLRPGRRASPPSEKKKRRTKKKT